MADETIERMNYFQFQQIGAEDFRIEQAYHRDARARHDLGPHSWGIVEGCRIVETPREGDAGFVDLKLTPGLATDGFGRRIVLLEPVAVPPELFAAFNSELAKLDEADRAEVLLYRAGTVPPLGDIEEVLGPEGAFEYEFDRMEAAVLARVAPGFEPDGELDAPACHALLVLLVKAYRGGNQRAGKMAESILAPLNMEWTT